MIHDQRLAHTGNPTPRELSGEICESEVSVPTTVGSEHEITVSGLDPETQILSQELDRILQSSLLALKPKYRDVFILAVFEKMSYEEISKVVGRSLLSVIWTALPTSQARSP